MRRMRTTLAVSGLVLAMALSTGRLQADSVQDASQSFQQKLQERMKALEAQGLISPDAEPVQPDNAAGSTFVAQCGDITRFLKVAMQNGDTPRTLVGIYSHQIYGCGRSGMAEMLGMPSLAGK